MKSKINTDNIKQFVKLELNGWTKPEIVGLLIVLSTIFINAILMRDSIISVISAICGILYTIIAGKGKISCYFFGLIGTSFYGYLAYHNALYGNLILYIGYYFPMQILGIFQWKKHLKKSTNEIIKTKLSPKELVYLSIIGCLTCFIFSMLLKTLNDTHPYIDGITTVLSIFGMYMTVKRVIEQWIVWMIVNALSVFMWLNIAIQGEKVYATVIMWLVYFVLSIYFYRQWRQEIGRQC